MSLFPAYCGNDQPTDSVPKSPKSDRTEETVSQPDTWLENTSFDVRLEDIPLPSVLKTPNDVILIEDEDDHVLCNTFVPASAEQKAGHKIKVKKHKEKKIVKNDRLKDIHLLSDKWGDDCYEDKKREKGNLGVKTLSRPAVPLYHTQHRAIGHNAGRISKKKKKKIKRYYKRLLELQEEFKFETDKKSKISRTVEKSKKKLTSDEAASQSEEYGTSLEQELSKKTAQFNKTLTEEPRNVEMWLKYVRFQDAMSDFERLYRRGGGAKGRQLTAERKLAILEKALSFNPENEALLKERLVLLEQVLSVEEMIKQLGQLVEQHPSNVTLWTAYAGVRQCSLAQCSVSAVMELYNKGMARLHQFRRGVPALHTLPTEKKILDLLLRCGLFLRQAGMFEQLWTLLKMYLNLNLTLPESNYFAVTSVVAEDTLSQMEETVLTSQLPMSELWLRVETLREGAHWMPVKDDSNCDDPQRLVFAEDVSDLLHPITTPVLSLRLAMITMTLLKVPLLPSRDSAQQFLGVTCIPWGLDSLEPVLAALFFTGTVDLSEAVTSVLGDIADMLSRPQYLCHQFGQEQYLEFVVKVFRLCGDCLRGTARTSFFVWWLRFERFLISLNKKGLCKLPQNRKKKIKSQIKEFLKQEQNRNTHVFYQEYALLEHELGNFDSACKILRTAVCAYPTAVPVVSVVVEEDRAGLCSLYRTLCELLLARGLRETVATENARQRQLAVTVLVRLALGLSLSPLDTETDVSPDQVLQAADKYHHITTELFASTQSSDVDGTENFLPNFVVDWICCHSWFLFLSHSIWKAAELVERALTVFSAPSSLEGAQLTQATCWREALFECYVTMLHHHCQETASAYSAFQEVLHRALREFPNNLYFLATVTTIETSSACVGSPWWKLTRSLDATAMLPRLFLVFLARRRQAALTRAAAEGHVFLQLGGPVVPASGSNNRVAALFRQLLDDPATKRCPLIWRQYFQFLYQTETVASWRSAFYRAVEECPWVKALYVDAAKLLPAELPQVQDLLIEKELRLHVTPEELEILRSDPPS